MNTSDIKIPNDRPLYEGEIASYWLEDGILVALSKPALRTVQSLQSNLNLVREITGGQKKPLLIYLADSPVPDKAARRFSSEHVGDNYTAMAMVSKPGLAQFIINILFKLKPPPIPMKSFTDDNEARKWLMQFK